MKIKILYNNDAYSLRYEIHEVSDELNATRYICAADSLEAAIEKAYYYSGNYSVNRGKKLELLELDFNKNGDII